MTRFPFLWIWYVDIQESISHYYPFERAQFFYLKTNVWFTIIITVLAIARNHAYILSHMIYNKCLISALIGKFTYVDVILQLLSITNSGLAKIGLEKTLKSKWLENKKIFEL